jgi:hypothetical protein
VSDKLQVHADHGECRMTSPESLPLLSPRPLPNVGSKRRSWLVMALFSTFLTTIVVALLTVQYVWANPLSLQSLPRTSSQSQLHDRLGAVASESSICSRIGINLLRDGGNAADAVRCSERTALTVSADELIACWHGLLHRSNWHVPQRHWRRWLYAGSRLEWLIRIHRLP